MQHKGTVRLETERLILRKFKLDDAKDMYYNWASDPLCNKYLSWELHKDIEETKTIIQKWISEYDFETYNWVVELKDTHELIGAICVVHMRDKDLNCEVGYCYGSKFWGKGYATEALRKVVQFLITECGIYLVEARHISDNPASGKVMQKAGMHKDAILASRRINKNNNKLNDLIIYSINKNEL